MHKAPVPREGDLYKVINIEDITFRIIYGYYEESERDRVEPLPVFPDLKENPLHTASGKPIVTAIQEACEHYTAVNAVFVENCCGDCINYLNSDHEISICVSHEKML